MGNDPGVAKPATMATLRLIWGALTASIGLYVLALVFLTSNPEYEPQQPPQHLMAWLMVAAMGTGVASLWLPQFRQRRRLREIDFETVEVEDPDHMPGVGRTIREAADPSAVRQKALATFQTAMLVGCALAESVALWGFAGCMMGLELVEVAPFFLVAFVLISVHFPTWTKVLAPLEQLRGVRVPQPK